MIDWVLKSIEKVTRSNIPLDLESTNSPKILQKEKENGICINNDYVCFCVDGKTKCMPPHTLMINMLMVIECMLDGYTKSYDKIVELGKDDVNKFNIYIKFGCNENNSNKTPTSYIIIK